MRPVDDRHEFRQSADDAAVIARVLKGEKQQFAQLVGRYQAGLYRYAVTMVLDHDVASDMVQDTFVKAYTNLKSCRDHTRFAAWLFQMVRNRCLDHLKDVRRRNVRLDDAGQIVDQAAGPATLAERARLRVDISQALGSLPSPQREAFLLHYVGGMPYEEMATLLDASVSALKMRVSRAREALSTAMQNHEVTQSPRVRLFVRRG